MQNILLWVWEHGLYETSVSSLFGKRPGGSLTRRASFPPIAKEIALQPDLSEVPVPYFFVVEPGKNCKVLEVWTDGACLANGTDRAVAGIGIWFGPDHPLNTSEVYKDSPSNQRAEIRAATRAAEIVVEAKPEIRGLRIHSDSKYLRDCWVEWIPRWQDRGWITNAGKPVKNEVELKRMVAIFGSFDSVEICYVPGHSGDIGNSAADALAQDAAKRGSSELVEESSSVPNKQAEVEISAAAWTTNKPLVLTIGLGRHFIRGLVDSGATGSFLDTETWSLAREFGSLVPSRPMTVRVANGAVETSAEEMAITAVLEDHREAINFRLLSSLPIPCILGLDFLRRFGIVLDFSTPAWAFRSLPEKSHSFESEVREANYLMRIAEITPAQRRQLGDIVNREIPARSGKLSSTPFITHKIDVANHAPIRQKFRPVSPAKFRYINEEVDRMLESGIIEPSKSAWSTPIVVVKNSAGKLRFCLDFRALNKVTKKDAYPIPDIDSILKRLRNARYITTLDLCQAYFQVLLAKESREKTAFAVPGRGLFHFKRMPFGLTNAPATFQRLMDNLFGSEFEGYLFVYLDDVILISETFEEHIVLLEKVLRKIREANLTLNKEKSHFGASRVKYLGFLLDREGLHLDHEKVAPLLELPVPRTVKQVRRLLGMASWNRKFLPDLATVVAPLSQLLKANQKWQWGEDQARAYARLRELLTSAPTLTCPNFDEPFLLQCNASSVGLGAVLSQKSGQEERIVAFASRTMSDLERRYAETERECLAVVWAIEKFRPYLESSKFVVYTDVPSIRWLLNSSPASGRIARWALKLQSYDFVVASRKTQACRGPELLSHAPADADVSLAESAENKLDPSVFAQTKDTWYTKMRDAVEKEPERHPDWL